MMNATGIALLIFLGLGLVAICVLAIYFKFLMYDYMIERAKYIWNEEDRRYDR